MSSSGSPRCTSYKASLIDHLDLLARSTAAPPARRSPTVRRPPESPTACSSLVTVPASNAAGAGTTLYEAVSDWARERELDTIEAVVADNDPDSLAFARAARLRRGAAREGRRARPRRRSSRRRSSRPTGVEIVTWAERPELARGMYEVAVEAYARRPRLRGRDASSRSRTGSPTTCRAQATGRRRPSSRSPATRWSATRSSRSPLRSRRRAHHDLTGGQASLARPRGRPGAEGDADRLGEGEWLRGAADAQRRAQRADPPPERAVRLPARDRADLPAGAARMSSPPVQYAMSGDVEIAYQVLGDGPPDLVWVAGAITHLDVLWEHAGLPPLLRAAGVLLAPDRLRQARDGPLRAHQDRDTRGAHGRRAGRAGRGRLRASGADGRLGGWADVHALRRNVPRADPSSPPRRCGGEGGDDRRLALGRVDARGVRRLRRIDRGALGQGPCRRAVLRRRSRSRVRRGSGSGSCRPPR